MRFYIESFENNQKLDEILPPLCRTVSLEIWPPNGTPFIITTKTKKYHLTIHFCELNFAFGKDLPANATMYVTVYATEDISA